MNKKEIIEDLTVRKILMAEMYHSVEMQLCSQRTGFSMTKTNQKLSELGKNFILEEQDLVCPILLHIIGPRARR